MVVELSIFDMNNNHITGDVITFDGTSIPLPNVNESLRIGNEIWIVKSRLFAYSHNNIEVGLWCDGPKLN
jgi:hypothetical protein